MSKPMYKCVITMEDSYHSEDQTNLRVTMQFDPAPTGEQLQHSNSPSLNLANVLKAVIDAWHESVNATQRTFTTFTKDNPEEGTITE